MTLFPLALAGFPLAIGGMPEWLIILAVVMLLFGARKLPDLARSMGSSITQFKKGLREEEQETSDVETKKVEPPRGADAE